MNRPLFPSFLDTARVGADGNLTGLLVEVREPNPNATEPDDPPGPARGDLTIYVTHIRTNTQIPVAHDEAIGGYVPTGAFPVEAGDMIEVHIPAAGDFAQNTTFVQVQPAA